MLLLLSLEGFDCGNSHVAANQSQGKAPVLRLLQLFGVLVPSPVLYASHGRRAVVDPDAGAVWSSVASLDSLQIQL